MYESFFGFVKRPFLAASTLDRYFPATSIEQACQTASRAIQRGEGPVAIFGGTGLGKTMCCMRIAESFRRNFEVVTLASSQLITRRALLQSLLFELRMPYRDMTEGELRLTLMSRLQPSTDNPTDGLVLIIDEAQTMSMKLLDEIRLLTNVVRNGIPRVRLVLCGTMRLEDCLSHPHMDSLNQRLAARCYLTPLSNQETSQYVIHKIELSGVDGSSVMTRESLDAIYRGSDGIPRLIDQLTDQSLLLACTERERPVSAAMVGRAWCMLQQLPNPWSEPESIVKTTSPSTIVSSAPTSGSTLPPNISMAGQTQATPYSTGTTQAASVFGMNTIGQAEGLASGFEAMMKGTSTSNTSSSHSNVEFGQLDDDFQEDQESVSPASFGMPTSYVDSKASESDFEEMRLAPEPVKQPSKNLLDVFAGDFDEEFTIPVQSSDSYQAYSGASYGNLNYDLSSFGVVNKPVDEEPLAFDEANDFFTAPTPSQRLAISSSFQDDQEYAQEVAPNLDRHEDYYADTPIEAVSNISPEQAANLERQIEEEMRDLVSGLNMSAMTFDPMTTLDPWGHEDQGAYAESAQPNSDELRLAHLAHSDVIGLAGMHSFSTFSEAEQVSTQNSDRNSDQMGDDRDLLVIEDDLELVRGGVTQAVSGSNRAVLHPYAKLFTKLRNS